MNVSLQLLGRGIVRWGLAQDRLNEAPTKPTDKNKLVRGVGCLHRTIAEDGTTVFCHNYADRTANGFLCRIHAKVVFPSTPPKVSEAPPAPRMVDASDIKRVESHLIGEGYYDLPFTSPKLLRRLTIERDRRIQRGWERLPAVTIGKDEEKEDVDTKLEICRRFGYRVVKQ